MINNTRFSNIYDIPYFHFVACFRYLQFRIPLKSHHLQFLKKQRNIKCKKIWIASNDVAMNTVEVNLNYLIVGLIENAYNC